MADPDEVIESFLDDSVLTRHLTATAAAAGPAGGVSGNFIKEFTKPTTIPAGPKELAARVIAEQIVNIFGVAVIGSLLVGFVATGWVVFLAWSSHRPLDEGLGIVSKGLVPILTTVGTFGSTLFGPLLAFVLGYYFGEKSKDNGKGA